jgi:hypothetical protein
MLAVKAKRLLESAFFLVGETNDTFYADILSRNALSRIGESDGRID